jgi:hypothetical protein
MERVCGEDVFVGELAFWHSVDRRLVLSFFTYLAVTLAEVMAEDSGSPGRCLGFTILILLCNNLARRASNSMKGLRNHMTTLLTVGL